MLRRESFVLAAPADWQLPEGVDADLVLAAELPWIWIPRGRTPDYHDQVAAFCRAAGFTPRAQHFAQSMESQLAMVAAGLGVALVPATSARAAASRNPITPVQVRNSITVELAAVWHSPGTRLLAGFLEALSPAPASR